MVDQTKNILLISYYFAPSNIVGAKRFSYLSYCLSDAGFNIFVLTVKEKYNLPEDDSIPFSGKITRTSMLPPYYEKADTIFKKIIRRIWETFALADEYAGWIIPAIFKGIKVIRKNNVDKIIVTGPPFSQFIIGYILKAIFKKRFIIDYQDPWTFYLHLHGIKRNSSRYKFNLWLERKMLDKADKIVFNTNLAKIEYCKTFSFIKNIEEKSVVIENAFVPVNNIEPLSLEKNKKIILYAGNFYGERKLSYLFRPIQQLNEEGAISKDSLAIHVFGKITDEDKNYLSKYNFNNLVTEHNKVSTHEVLKFMKGADILYLPQGDDVNYSVPYKFFDYLSVKKPILAVTPVYSATAEVIKETGCGETGNINDSTSVYTALKKILCDKKNYTFNAEQYTWASISSKYMKLIDSL